MWQRLSQKKKKQPLIWAPPCVTFLDLCCLRVCQFFLCVYTNQANVLQQFWAVKRSNSDLLSVILGWNETWCEPHDANGLHAHTLASARQITMQLQFLTPVFWPRITLRNPSWKVLYFALPPLSASSFYPLRTTLPLTPARGHPPADGTIPVPFDTEFAL